MKHQFIKIVSLVMAAFAVFGNGSVSRAGAEEQYYWINPDGGTKYHWVHYCPSIHPRYYDGMIEITEDQLNIYPYNILSPCNVCQELDPVRYDHPDDVQENASSGPSDFESLQDRLIQQAKGNLTEVYGYTEEQAESFQFLFHAEGELEYWPDEDWNHFPFPESYYTVAGVHLREKTSSRSRDMGLLNPGTVIHKTGEADGDPFIWYQTELGFLKGYVASQYVCADDAGAPAGDVYEPLPVAETTRKTELKSGTGWFDGKIADVPEGTRMHVLFERDGWLYVVIPKQEFSFFMDVKGEYGFVSKDSVITGQTVYELDWQ